jgi:hypothetical protein
MEQESIFLPIPKGSTVGSMLLNSLRTSHITHVEYIRNIVFKTRPRAPPPSLEEFAYSYDDGDTRCTVSSYNRNLILRQLSYIGVRLATSCLNHVVNPEEIFLWDKSESSELHERVFTILIKCLKTIINIIESLDSFEINEKQFDVLETLVCFYSELKKKSNIGRYGSQVLGLCSIILKKYFTLFFTYCRDIYLNHLKRNYVSNTYSSDSDDSDDTVPGAPCTDFLLEPPLISVKDFPTVLKRQLSRNIQHIDDTEEANIELSGIIIKYFFDTEKYLGMSDVEIEVLRLHFV